MASRSKKKQIAIPVSALYCASVLSILRVARNLAVMEVFANRGLGSEMFQNDPKQFTAEIAAQGCRIRLLDSDSHLQYYLTGQPTGPGPCVCSEQCYRRQQPCDELNGNIRLTLAAKLSSRFGQ